ncbi:unnamed protein product [Rhizophagus irregularis]|nr:unnamed protein product [Rhizophagus irregularis]CAB5390308.1 unnamed protein product [Rhizophagus irregularis]
MWLEGDSFWSGIISLRIRLSIVISEQIFVIIEIQTVRQLREIWCDLNLVKISFSNSSPLDPKKECDFAKLLYEFPGNINLLGSKDEY